MERTKFTSDTPADEFPEVWECEAHSALEFEFDIDGNKIEVVNSNVETLINKHVFLAVNEYVEGAMAYFWLTDQDGVAPESAKICFSTECPSDEFGNPQFVYFDLEEICAFEDDDGLEEARAKVAVLERCLESGRASIARMEQREAEENKKSETH